MDEKAYSFISTNFMFSSFKKYEDLLEKFEKVNLDVNKGNPF